MSLGMLSLALGLGLMPWKCMIATKVQVLLEYECCDGKYNRYPFAVNVSTKRQLVYENQPPREHVAFWWKQIQMTSQHFSVIFIDK